MAYKEKCQLDITPQGDTLQDSNQEKNRDELLNVAQQMEPAKAGWRWWYRWRWGYWWPT